MPMHSSGDLDAAADHFPSPPTTDLDDQATLRVVARGKAKEPVEDATLIMPKAAAMDGASTSGAAAGAGPRAVVPVVFRRRIAQGGMGAVLEATDCRLGRTIAAKVMLSEADCSEDQKQRFIQEAMVLGRLAHPNIVPVYDLGHDPEGQLYYTMKLVKGVTLQRIVDDLRGGKAEALQHYKLDRLLMIFLKVCDALAFAHSQGIIHRDLKPENIMVGEFGEVLVMDWGIAKILGIGAEAEPNTPAEGSHAEASPRVSTSSFTATMEGAVMGTPNYMSPEQAMGKVNEMDARSDIFSLGGILYCLLTLRPPVEGKDVWEVLEKVRAADVTPPTSYGAALTQGRSMPAGAAAQAPSQGRKASPLPHLPGGQVPAALGAVVMKALTLDKAKRYPQVQAFSADIEAYHGGFATTAENATMLTLLRLFVRRHKVVFTAALSVTLALVGGIIVSTMKANEARLARDAEKAQRTQAESERDAKEVARKDAEDIAKFLGDVFQRPDPSRDGRTITVAETLASAAGKLDTQLAGQPEQRARLQATLGRTYYGLGLYSESIPLFEKAREHFRSALGPEHVETLAVTGRLINAYRDSGRKTDALPLAEEMVVLRRKLNQPAAIAMFDLSNLYQDSGRWDEALKLREELLPIARKVNGPESETTTWAMHGLGTSYRKAGRLKEAVHLHEEVLRLRRKHAGPEHPNTLWAMHTLAETYRSAKQPEEALKLQEEVVPLMRKVLGLKHTWTINGLDALAASYAAANRRQDVVKVREEMLQIRRETRGLTHPDTVKAMSQLADACRAAGEPGRAEALEKEKVRLEAPKQKSQGGVK